MYWDEYFLKVCNTVAENSKCHSRQVGAIVVIDNSIISTGYNGPPRGVPDCKFRDSNSPTGCPRHALGYKSGEGLEWCVAGHAERNALINAARHGVCVKGATMYMNCGIPCKDCLIEIINAGITEIVVTNLEYYDKMSEYLLRTSGLKYRLYKEIL